MAYRVALSLGFLAVISSSPLSMFCGEQFPRVPERCSVPVRPRKVIATWRKVVIERINFDGPIGLSQSDVAKLIREENQKELNADDPEWVNEVVEVGLRGTWMNHGFFNAKATAEASSLGGDSTKERFLVTAHLEEGLQYRLRDIQFVGEAGIPEADMRREIPLRNGDLFNVALVREGIESLTKLYNSHGYIDFTTAPQTEVDDDPGDFPQISLVMNLDEEKQFHIRNVEIVGLDPRLEIRLRGLVRPGEIYNYEAIADFLKEEKSASTSGLSLDDAMQVRHNGKVGVVDLTFDFRPCPSPGN